MRKSCRSCRHSHENADARLVCALKMIEIVLPIERAETCRSFEYEPGTDERENVISIKLDDAEKKQTGSALLQLILAMGIVATAVTAPMIDAGVALEEIVRDTPTSSLQAADRVGQCHGMCAEILDHDRVVKAEWAAQIVAKQINEAQAP